MSAERPNHVRVRCGEHGSHGNFGNKCQVHPKHVTSGLGHVPHLAALFEGGLELDMTPQALANFIRAGQEALSKIPHRYLEVADHVGGGEG